MEQNRVKFIEAQGKWDIVRQQKEDHMIATKNKIIQKCRVANWFSKIQAFKWIRLILKKMHVSKESLIHELRKKWANKKMVRAYREYLLRFGDPRKRVY